jgi:hypothetical protein
MTDFCEMGLKRMIVESKPCASGTILVHCKFRVTEGHSETFLLFYFMFKNCFFSRPIVTEKEIFLIV